MKLKNEIRSTIYALLIAILIRSIIFEPFSIPSGSMKPNYLVGDYLFVSKYYYGISRYSFPFWPNIFSGRVWELHKPKRGDVIVFRQPSDPSIHYIKRLIGLPGDRIQLIDGYVYLNGKKLEQKQISDFVDQEPYPHETIKRLVETIDDNTSYEILDYTPFGDADNTDVFEVPEGKYFFMGDNRDNSHDSRKINGKIGFVPEEFIIGRAEFVLFSNPESLFKIWEWVFSFNKDRFFLKAK